MSHVLCTIALILRAVDAGSYPSAVWALGDVAKARRKYIRSIVLPKPKKLLAKRWTAFYRRRGVRHAFKRRTPA
jgi:hypothetical protein